MKTLLILLLTVGSALAQLGTSIYTGATGSGKTTSASCVFVNFSLSGFTGSIGNASFSNITLASLPVYSAYQGGSGQRLNPIPYTVTSGTLIITEVK